MNRLLQTLLARPDVWQASRPRTTIADGNALPSGHAALDRVLHRGGWPRAALTEVLSGNCGIGEMQLLAPALAHCSRGSRRLFFVCPPYLPYAPALLAQNVALERLLVVRAERESRHPVVRGTDPALRCRGLPAGLAARITPRRLPRPAPAAARRAGQRQPDIPVPPAAGGAQPLARRAADRAAGYAGAPRGRDRQAAWRPGGPADHARPRQHAAAAAHRPGPAAIHRGCLRRSGFNRTLHSSIRRSGFIRTMHLFG